MQRVEAYRAADGKLFESSTSCQEYEAVVEFEQWYDCHSIDDIIDADGSPCESCTVTAASIEAWLIDNRQAVLAFLNAVQ